MPPSGELNQIFVVPVTVNQGVDPIRATKYYCYPVLETLNFRSFMHPETVKGAGPEFMYRGDTYIQASGPLPRP